jgi:hypothetical protein
MTLLMGIPARIKFVAHDLLAVCDVICGQEESPVSLAAFLMYSFIFTSEMT